MQIHRWKRIMHKARGIDFWFERNKLFACFRLGKSVRSFIGILKFGFEKLYLFLMKEGI